MKSTSFILLLLAGLCNCAQAGLSISTAHLRIVGLGNSQNQWNSILEVRFPGVSIDHKDIVVQASSHDGNVPENVLDNDLETRFSSVGPGQWISFAFPEEVQIGSLEIAYHNNAQRVSYFYIETSGDNETWSPVLLGASTEGNPGFETVTFSEESREDLHTLLDRINRIHERVRKLYHRYAALRQVEPCSPLVVRYFDILAWLNTSFNRKHIIPYKSPLNFTLDEAEAIVAALEQGRDYLDTIDTPEVCWAHYSTPDDSNQPFVLRLPEQFDPKKTYPLIVELHGHGVRPSLSDNPKASGDFFHVIPLVRGDNSYQGIGSVTVRELIDYMVRAFPVDPRRIHLTGQSMGGQGTWNIATRHPDLFASTAPTYGYAQGYYLQNLRQMPLFISHGLKDFVVPSDLSRYARDILERYDIPSVYHEYPEEAHSAVNMIPPYTWQVQHVNKNRDHEFEFTTDHPFRGKHYWVKVLAKENLRRKAVIRAKVSDATVELHLDNVRILRIDTGSLPVKNGKVEVRINGTSFIATVPRKRTPLFVRKTGKKYRIEAASMVPSKDPGPCLSGGAGNLYTGDPLLVVYGTAGEPAKDVALKHLAGELALHCVPRARMLESAFPVKADVDVDDNDLKHYNLLLLGGPGENSISAKVQPSLPLKVSKGNLVIEGLKDLPLENLWYGIYYYNPIVLQKRLYLVNLDHVDAEDVMDLKHQVDLLVPGMDVNRPMSTPDLIAVHKGKIARRLQLDNTWGWDITSSYGKPAPSAIFSREAALPAYARAFQSKCGTDFGLSTDRDLTTPYPLSIDAFTRGDFETDRHHVPSIIAGASCQQIQSIAEMLAKNGGFAMFPDPVPEDLDRQRTYTLAMNPDSFWIFRRFDFNFLSIRAGPDIGPLILLNAGSM